MHQFQVLKAFRDKYTNEHYVPGVIFVCDETERITDLQTRGLIGGEILQSPPIEDVVEVAEETEATKDVKKRAPSRKTSSKNKSE